MNVHVKNKYLVAKLFFFFSPPNKNITCPESFARMYRSYLVEVRFKIILNKDRLLLYPNFEEKKSLHGCLYPYLFYLQVNCAASVASFIWMPAGFLNLNLLFVSLCCVGLCQGYVNWLSAGGFVPLSDGEKQTFSFPLLLLFFFHFTFLRFFLHLWSKSAWR